MAVVVLFVMFLTIVCTRAEKSSTVFAFTPRNPEVNIQGSGAISVDSIVQGYITTYRRDVASNVNIGYFPIGNAKGIEDFIGADQLKDFAFATSPIPDDKMKDDLLHVPVFTFPVAIIYNLKGITKPVRLSGSVLERIYRGDITKWNHESIRADNPTITLPDQNIVVIYRDTESGTSYVLTSYFKSLSGSWEATMKFEPTAPERVGVKDGTRMMDTVSAREGALGYVSYAEFLKQKPAYVSIAKIKNRYSEKWLRPSIYGAAKASDPDRFGDGDMRVSVVDMRDPRAYPITGVVWVLIHKQQYKELSKAQAITDFICWILEQDQQNIQRRKGYAPLRDEVRNKAMNQLEKVTVNNERAFTRP